MSIQRALSNNRWAGQPCAGCLANSRCLPSTLFYFYYYFIVSMQQRALSRVEERKNGRGRWRTRWTPLQFIAYALTTCLQAFLSFPHLCGFRLSCQQTKKSPSALLPHMVRQWKPAPSNSTGPVQCPFRTMCADCSCWGTAIFAAQAARASMVPQGPRTTRLTLRPNELFWFNLSNQTEQSIGPPPILPQTLVMLEKSIFMLVKGLTANGDSYSVQRWITAQIQAMNSALK